MSRFDIVVDTAPMANKIDGVTLAVGTVGSAVGAMETELIRSDKDNTKMVCAKVSSAFYMLTRNQLALKAIGYQSKADTNVMSLQRYTTELQRIQSRMNHDFHLIAGRYEKIFREIDANLQYEINRMDHAVVTLAKDQVPKLHTHLLNQGAMSFTYQSELVPRAQLAVTSKFKQSCFQLLSVMKQYLYDFRMMTTQFEAFETKSVNEMMTYYLPVVTMESGDLSQKEGSIVSFHVHQTQADFHEEHQRATKFLETKNWKKQPWQAVSHTEKGKIREAYLSLIASLPENEQQEMLRLFDASTWETFTPKEVS
jgi:hypothetical protein